MSLIALVADFMKSEKLRRRYALKPLDVLADYEVKAPLLKIMQRQGLPAALAAEVKSLQMPGGIHPLGWGIPAMKVDGFSPTSATRGVSFTLTITGEGFTSKTKAAVAEKSNLEPFVEAKSTKFVSSKKVVGTFVVDEPGTYVVGVFVPAAKSEDRLGTYLDDGEALLVTAMNPLKKLSKRDASRRR